MSTNGLISPNQFLDPARPSNRPLRGDISLLFADDARVFARPPKTLGELVTRLEADESFRNPDVVLRVSELEMTRRGNFIVPGKGEFDLNAWSQRQLALRLGIRWNSWFHGIDPELRAQEINRRLERDAGTVRLRTDMIPQVGSEGTIRGFVSPSYTPVSDALVARSLGELVPNGHASPVTRYDATERTVSYVVQVAERFALGGPARVGDVTGGVLVRNSDVGFASLLVGLHVTRLVCMNGLAVPESHVTRRAHHGLTSASIPATLSLALKDLPARIRRGARALEASGHHAIPDVRRALRDVLEDARLPVRLLPIMIAAYACEPHPSVFGIVQAITLGAQHATVNAEDRIALERAAAVLLGRYAV